MVVTVDFLADDNWDNGGQLFFQITSASSTLQRDVPVSPHIKYRNPIHSIQLFLNLTQLFSIESAIVYCKRNKSEKD